MRGGEEVRRRRFARKEQAAIDRRGKHRALAGMPGQGMRIGASRERVLPPAGFGERFELSTKVIAEQVHDLVDGLCGRCALTGYLPRSREASAEKAFDAGLTERTKMIA